MDAFLIRGGRPLRGKVAVSGSKNASLPVIAASLLSSGESHIRRVPDLADTRTLGELLETMGATVNREGSDLRIDASSVDNPEAPYELVRTMRASILVLGPLLARFGRAKVSLPGGCAIGARPIDQHLKGLERLGAKIHIEHGYVHAECKRLVGNEYHFEMPTVGGTENLMLAASLAEGVTVLTNAACEPEIVDLAKALIGMGVEVEGAGSERLVIHGSSTLRPVDHAVVADRIEFGTYLVAGAMAGESLTVTGGVPKHQDALIGTLRAAGATVEIDGDTVSVSRANPATCLDIVTEPYPGFPTDMQAQLMALLCTARGQSRISENIFENRFMHVAELQRLGANIRVDGGRAIIEGVSRLSGTTVMATDLRASACLVLAGLVADGETVIRRVYHLDRGYETLAEKLRAVGAKAERFSE